MINQENKSKTPNTNYSSPTIDELERILQRIEELDAKYEERNEDQQAA
tara:strand:+ start:306 stop:449 length:144 start_codon:yes stop_codon:yes gene_type:complete